MNPSRARWAVAVAAVALLACQKSEPVARTVRIGEVWNESLRAIVEEDLGPTGARVRLTLVDGDGREAELVLQEFGQRWSKAVFTHDENQQWFLHPVSDARPPLVFIDFVFSEIRVGTNPKISISALDWKQVDPPRAHP